MIPVWLKRTLGDTYRTATLRTCPHCHTPVLSGLDADNCAFSVRADPTPINEIGEALALLTGRRTFDLVGNASGKRLYVREEHNIKSGRRYLVFPEHRCGQSLAAHIEQTPSRPRKVKPNVPQF